MNNRLIAAIVLSVMSNVLVHAQGSLVTLVNETGKEAYVYYGNKPINPAKEPKLVKSYTVGVNGRYERSHTISEPTYFFISLDSPSDSPRLGYWFKVPASDEVNLKLIAYGKKTSSGDLVMPLLVPHSKSLEEFLAPHSKSIEEADIMLLDDALQDVESVKSIKKGHHTFFNSSVRF